MMCHNKYNLYLLVRKIDFLEFQILTFFFLHSGYKEISLPLTIYVYIAFGSLSHFYF